VVGLDVSMDVSSARVKKGCERDLRNDDATG
jgi:hypothetical protein